MNTSNMIAVIGGTGKSGKYLINELLSRNFQIRALHRAPETIDFLHKNLTWIKGDARDTEAVSALVAGCAAVISTLGQPKGEKSIFSDASRNVIRAASATGIDRYIVTTGIQVDTPADRKSEKTTFATNWMKSNYPETTTDKQMEYQLLSESKLNWTLVRLPLITLTDERKPVTTSLQDCPGEQIGAADLAAFLANQLTDNEFLKQAPFLANA